MEDPAPSGRANPFDEAPPPSKAAEAAAAPSSTSTATITTTATASTPVHHPAAMPTAANPAGAPSIPSPGAQQPAALATPPAVDPTAAKEEAALPRETEAEERARIQTETAVAAHDTERANMLNMSKIAIKTVIESSIGLVQPIQETHHPVRQLLVLLETIFEHGLREKRSKFGSAKKLHLWAFIEASEKVVPIASPALAAVRENTSLKTLSGKARAWLRTMVMRKELAVFMPSILDHQVVREFYEPWSFLAGDEAMVVSGLVVGLNTIDLSLRLEGKFLDSDLATIDYALYLKDGNYLKPTVAESTDERFSEASFSAINDQKAYLEEMNARLKKSVDELTRQLAEAQATAESKSQTAEQLQVKAEALQAQADQAVQDREEAEDQCSRKLKVYEADIAVERNTYQQSRTGLDEMLGAMHKQMETEQELRETLESELQDLRRQKAELEAKVEEGEALAADKEETISALRNQLKDVKSLNITMLSNLQQMQDKVKDKEILVRREQGEVEDLNKRIKALQGKLRDTASTKQRLESTLSELTNRLKDVDNKRTATETNMMIERQWRESLQKDLEQEREKTAQMEIVKRSLDELSEEHDQLKIKNSMLQESYAEQEQALNDMGLSLAQAAMKAHDMETTKKLERAQTWVDDRQITECKACNKSFGVTRRKHHCRSCGDIYCNDCSDNRMPLPSSAKPVRVCDFCQANLLQQMSA